MNGVEGMRARFGGAKIAIAIEQARGPVIYALMAYDFIVLYPINPSPWPDSEMGDLAKGNRRAETGWQMVTALGDLGSPRPTRFDGFL